MAHAYSPRPGASSSQPAPKHPSIQDEGNWFQFWHFDNKTPPRNARALALQQAAKLPVSRIGVAVSKSSAANGVNASATQAAWTPLGPQPIACAYWSCGNTDADSGRVTALAVNPQNGNDIWLGAADGGLWHSTDGGSTWTPITDNQPTLSIGSIAIDPNNPSNIYVGTGEGNLNGDSYGGVGVLKSTDGGGSWTLYGESSLSGMGIPRIAVDPYNSSNLLAAVDYTTTRNPANSNYGIWQSTDAGQTWTHLNVGGLGAIGTDVVFDPARNGVAYVGVSQTGVFETTDHGATWTLVSGLPNGTSSFFYRIGLGISANGNKLYVVYQGSGGTLLNGDIYVGTFASGAWTWSAFATPSDMASDDNEGQWWYDIYAMVDPTVSAGTTAYVGGVDLWQTTDGGATWTNLTNYYGGTTNVHADQHALAFLPGSSSYYIGNDGGIWEGTPGGSFTDLNGGGLNITQFYGGSIGEVGGNAQLYGGAQDNGEIQYPVGAITGATTWTEVYGGDGGDTAVDYTNNANVYEEYVYLDISKSTTGGGAGMGWLPVTNGINIPSGSNCAATSSCDPVNFVAPFVMSPTTPNVLVAGTDRVYLTSDGAQTWHAISSVLDSPCPNCVSALTALAIGGANQDIYAGDGMGNVYSTTNGGATWSGGPMTTIVPGIVTGLAVDPINPNVAYASVNGFDSGSSATGSHLFKTTNAGASWTDISASLPNIPFESVAVDPANHNEVVAGTDAGVFISADAGASWATLGVGLPNAAINQIFFDHTGSSLFVATHGRGMWELMIPQIATTPTSLVETTALSTNAAPQTFTLSNPGMATLNWTANNLPSWITSVAPSSGSIAPGGTQQITVNYNTSGYSTSQALFGSITVTDPNAGDSPYTLPVAVAVGNISKTWYFAEGFTGGSFSEYLTLANPNPTIAHVSVEYLLQNGSAPLTKSYTVSPNARQTVNVNQELNLGVGVSMVVTSDQPIIAERPMYFTYTGPGNLTVPGGTDVLGATSLGTQFDFGYLDTSANHQTYLTVLNQHTAAIGVSIAYYPAAGGAPITVAHSVPANARGTILVNSDVPPGSYSAQVSLSAAGLVERPMYLVDATTHDTGSADVMGASAPSTSWSFAEGFTGTGFNERYILSNPGASSTNVTITFQRADGTTNVQTLTLAPDTQQVVDANSVLGSGVSNSATVTSTAPILAERFMSFRYNGAVGVNGVGDIPGATDVMGATSLGEVYDFAEGYTGGSFGEYLTLQNPQSTTTQVTVAYLPQSGAPPTVVTYSVGAHSRYTVLTNQVMVGQSFSMEVLASQPIVAERPMYFAYGGSQTGGSDVIGYQP